MANKYFITSVSRANLNLKLNGKKQHLQYLCVILLILPLLLNKLLFRCQWELSGTSTTKLLLNFSHICFCYCSHILFIHWIYYLSPFPCKTESANCVDCSWRAPQVVREKEKKYLKNICKRAQLAIVYLKCKYNQQRF